MDISIEAREGDETYPWALMRGQTRLTNLREEEAADFRKLIEFWNTFPGGKMDDILDSLEYVSDVGPGPSIKESVLQDGYGPRWSIEGDDFMGMVHHLDNLQGIFGVREWAQSRWRNFGHQASEYKTKKELDWDPDK